MKLEILSVICRQKNASMTVRYIDENIEIPSVVSELTGITKDVCRNKGKPIMNGNSQAKVLEEMPDFSNSQTRATELRMGAFVFYQIESPRAIEVI